jgi:hypothetical protein
LYRNYNYLKINKLKLVFNIFHYYNYLNEYVIQLVSNFTSTQKNMKMAAESHEKEQRPAYTFAMMGSLTIDEDLVKKKMKTNISTTTTYSKTKKC